MIIVKNFLKKLLIMQINLQKEYLMYKKLIYKEKN